MEQAHLGGSLWQNTNLGDNAWVSLSTERITTYEEQNILFSEVNRLHEGGKDVDLLGWHFNRHGQYEPHPTQHDCILAFYGKVPIAPVGNCPYWDGEILSEEAARETVANCEAWMARAPPWILDTPFGPCTPICVYLKYGCIVPQLREYPPGMVSSITTAVQTKCNLC